MKKIILLSIVCFFFALVTNAQGTSLESFFNHYSEKEGFTYIYSGGKKAIKEQSDEFSSVKFIKTLTCENPPTMFLGNLKDILRKQKFELVSIVKDQDSNIETYQYESDNKNFDEVTIIIDDEDVFIKWVSGQAR